LKAYFDNIKRQELLTQQKQQKIASVKMPEKPRYPRNNIIIGIILIAGGALAGLNIMCLIMIGMAVIIFIMGHSQLEKERIKYNLAKSNFLQYQKEVVQEKELQEINSDIQRIRESKIYCPKCNSTNIQIVPRRWSLLTGFFTNKTDRVCVNCKHKF